ncbi:MAG: amidohydrolase [Firmicutes bacterium]|nr:amidohydrolase [Bacillota bacterium]
MDTIFYNGTIRTLDKAFPEVSAIAVKDGVVIAVGSDEEMLAMATENTKKVDLKGKFALPGFADSHMHLLIYGTYTQRIDMTNAKTYAEIKEWCKADAPKAREEGRWILGSCFNQDYWTDTNKMPDRHDLDEIADDVPIFLERACGHICLLNTKGLQVCGLWDEKEETTKETLDFGPDGRPNGYIRENTRLVPKGIIENFSIEEKKNMIATACQNALKQGIVQVHTDDFNVIGDNDVEENLQVFRELDEEVRLPIRICQQSRFLTAAGLQEFIDRGYKAGSMYTKHFKFGPIKIMADGSLGARSAAMRQDYANAPGERGLLLIPDDEIRAIYEIAHKNGFDVVNHCIGDAALEQALDAIENAIKKYPRADWRHGIVHCQIMDEALQDRFAKMNVLAYVQPVFVKADSLVVDDAVGSELAKQSYNWRRYIDLGVHMSGGSDCPVEPFDILPNIYYAVTRMGFSGKPWYPENAVTLDEAVRMFTVEPAYASYDEATRGTLGVGKYCDMVVLDKNIYEEPIEELLNTSVLMTIVDGEIAYAK